MTREQAINYLRSSGMSQEQIDAVVEALNPKGDLISRQDAIDAVEEIETRRLKGELDNLTYAPTIKMLQSLPSANQWIPCSERLPEEDTEVLISYRYKDGEGDTSNVDIDITSYGQMYFGGNQVGNYKHWRAPFEYFESNYEVIAWMPLPEPWKGER